MKQTLNLYKNKDTWLFDDSKKGITKEPFVEGSSELITELQARSGLSGDSLTITFSDRPFPEGHHTLLWQASREEGGWNKYYSKELAMDNWLCPVLLKYFEDAPEKLYVAMS